jgi:ABC-type multidrug transport system permease subunit
MKKRYMIWKDVHSFVRDFRSFALLFITPIFITALVGSLFMSSGAKDIPIIICTNHTNSVYNSTVSMIRGSEVFTVTEKIGGCKEYIESRLRQGIVRAGIIVPEVELGSTIEMYVDNTKPIGTFLQSYFNLISRDISNRLINLYIANAIQSVDSNQYEISQLESAINSLDSDLAKMEGDIGTLEAYGSVKASSDRIKTNSQGLRDNVSAIAGLAQGLGYADILDDISALAPQLDSIDSEAAALSDMGTNSTQATTSLASSITKLRDALKTISGSTDIIRAYILQVSKNMPQYSDPVKSRVIGFFGNKSYINFIFPSILIMIVMWMATFLSSINFIRQKSRGILRRIYVSPMSTRTIVMEKVAASTIISLIPRPFILGISFFMLGIELNVLNAILVFLAAALSVVIFSIIGLIIGSFSKTESTAILGSLIIIIPLMFMSGAFYPVEAFPTAMKAFADFLPINAGIRLVEGFLFYSFDWIELLFLVYTMAFYMLALTGMCWLFMRRSLKS